MVELRGSGASYLFRSSETDNKDETETPLCQGIREMPQAIVVLGFAHRHSEACRLRLERGVELFNALEDAWLIVTGGDTSNEGETEASFLARMAEERGMPKDRILKEDDAKYTIEVSGWGCE